MTAEMRDTPERVANNVKSVRSVHLIFKNKGNGMHALQRGPFKYIQERMACACKYNLMLKGSTCNLNWPKKKKQKKPINTENFQALEIRGIT